jgi:hypothetical protein
VNLNNISVEIVECSCAEIFLLGDLNKQISMSEISLRKIHFSDLFVERKFFGESFLRVIAITVRIEKTLSLSYLSHLFT